MKNVRYWIYYMYYKKNKLVNVVCISICILYICKKKYKNYIYGLKVNKGNWNGKGNNICICKLVYVLKKYVYIYIYNVWIKWI